MKIVLYFIVKILYNMIMPDLNIIIIKNIASFKLMLGFIPISGITFLDGAFLFYRKGEWLI